MTFEDRIPGRPLRFMVGGEWIFLKTYGQAVDFAQKQRGQRPSQAAAWQAVQDGIMTAIERKDASALSTQIMALHKLME